MGKYVAVGVLAVIVLAAVTYQPPERSIGQRAETRGQQLEGTYGEPAPPSPEATAPALPPGPAQEVATPPPPAPVAGAPIAEAPASPVTPVAQPTAQEVGQQYKVKKGQTLCDIAEEVLGDRARWKELYEANKERLPNPDTLREGMVLVFDEARQAAHELTKPRSGVAPAAPAPPAPVASSPAPSPARSGRTYTVSKGETLYSIAKRELGAGNRWKEIVQLNRLPSEHVGAGTVLRLPN